MFGRKPKAAAAAVENTWKPTSAATRVGQRGSVSSSEVRIVRGSPESFGRLIDEASGGGLRGLLGGLGGAAGAAPLAPRTHVDLYDMVRRLRTTGLVDFKAYEFAWWWKLMVDEEETCFQAVYWLMEMAVEHLKKGKGNQVLGRVGASHLRRHCTTDTSSSPSNQLSSVLAPPRIGTALPPRPACL